MIDLKGLLSVLVSNKTIKVNLFDTATQLLIISFDLPGYEALEDDIEDDEVVKVELVNLTTINVYIKRA